MSKNIKAFNLGAQCRRAGMSEQRMLDYYHPYRDLPAYNVKDLKAGWLWQQHQYEEMKGVKQ